jgi:hypothetical protein
MTRRLGEVKSRWIVCAISGEVEAATMAVGSRRQPPARRMAAEHGEGIVGDVATTCDMRRKVVSLDALGR